MQLIEYQRLPRGVHPKCCILSQESEGKGLPTSSYHPYTDMQYRQHLSRFGCLIVGISAILTFASCGNSNKGGSSTATTPSEPEVDYSYHPGVDSMNEVADPGFPLAGTELMVRDAGGGRVIKMKFTSENEGYFWDYRGSGNWGNWDGSITGYTYRIISGNSAVLEATCVPDVSNPTTYIIQCDLNFVDSARKAEVKLPDSGSMVYSAEFTQLN